MSYIETFSDSTGKSKQLEFRFHREARLRYRVEKLEDLEADHYSLLRGYIEHHETIQRPRIQELYDYAEGNNHEVSKVGRRREEDMADSRAVHNFGKAIASFKQGYLVGNPIRVDYEEDETTNEALKELSKLNDFHQLNRGLVLDLSKVGRAYDLVYRAKDDTTRAVKLDPLGTFVIFDMTLENHSIAGVRYYQKSQFDENKKIIELYTSDKIVTFEYDGELKEIDSKPHAFGLVPITEYLNTGNGMGDYETELSLIDLYDSAQSDTANYMKDLSDAILAVFGRISFPDYVDTVEKQIAFMGKMRKARMMNLEPPTDNEGKEGNIGAKYLYKQYDVNGTEAYKKRVVNDIHKFTNTPDMTDESFAGVQSGEAMKWKVFGLDQERVDMQALFERSLKRRYRLIATVSTILKEIKDFDVAKLKITFTPNLPKSLQEKIEAFQALGGEVSKETAMQITDIVEDPKAELKKLSEEEQGASRMSRIIAMNERLSDSDLVKEVIADGE
ncbi:phage portal protein [Streptococcus azizii]|uniref:Phage portal protein n=1 Tax=Streptococcus azizii TaxID=1579424 RepID=A0AB36JN26_9STRE|nr:MULTISPECIES: phage portal protein [Streptococcus]QBX22535.1 portal protein [Streptococcus phage Javan85]QBX31899.1 portal protein [Streptococcus phage Javan84]MBF0775970.1 phage portal protein [Streptococcus sp. 19428wD3_AN2]ONK26307.1 phage portal protein [Streptococcus azizii]ONK28208.1 phage portal protein [Streptococcus azizii]